MITYFIKSGLCLALLLAFYHLVLEREKMHKFNRFYLLGSILFSFLAPLFIIYVEAPQITETFIPITSSEEIINPTEIIIEKPIDYTQYVIFFYGLISLLLTFRFGKNLFSIIQKIRKNTNIKIDNANLVLVDDAITPHTFWNYIFINKNEYYKEQLATELYTHELTHAIQKHTLDIILIELLQIAFWINPTFIFLKKAIKLNHEFLADSNVITTHKNTTKYQYLLLNSATWNNKYYLASNLNYLLTKKRLKMMTKQSSRTKILLKKLAVIPLLTGFIFLFAERIEAQATITESFKELPTPTTPPKPLKVKKEVNFENSIHTSSIPLKKKGVKNIVSKNKKEVFKYQISTKPISSLTAKKTVNTKLPITFDKKRIELSSLQKRDSVIKPQKNLPKSSSNTLEKGWVYHNNQTYFYVIENGKTTYYDRKGNIVDLNLSSPFTKKTKHRKKIKPVKKHTNKKGWIYHNNTVYFYKIENGKTQYFTRFGEKTSLNITSPLTKTKKTVSDSIPNDIDYYVNGKKMSKEEALSILPKDIKRISVIKKTTPPRIEMYTKTDSIIPNKGLEQVGNKVYTYKITNGKKQYFNEKTGEQVTVKQPEPELYEEMTKRVKNIKKIFYVDDKQVSKEVFKKTVKNDKAYNLSMFNKKNDKNTLIIIAHKKDVDRNVLLKKYR